MGEQTLICHPGLCLSSRNMPGPKQPTMVSSTLDWKILNSWQYLLLLGHLVNPSPGIHEYKALNKCLVYTTTTLKHVSCIDILGQKPTNQSSAWYNQSFNGTKPRSLICKLSTAAFTGQLSRVAAMETAPPQKRCAELF